MARIKRGVTSHARHKKVIKQAKGYRGRRKNTIKVARQAVEKAAQYAYRDRRNRLPTGPRSFERGPDGGEYAFGVPAGFAEALGPEIAGDLGAGGLDN